MLLERVAEAPGRPLERALERLVRERLDLAAPVADQMVMMLVIAPRRLEAGDPVTGVHTLDETELGERVERSVDARDPDRVSRGRNPVVDLLGRAAAVLAVEVLDDRAPRAPAAEARPTEPVECLHAPAAHT